MTTLGEGFYEHEADFTPYSSFAREKFTTAVKPPEEILPKLYFSGEEIKIHIAGKVISALDYLWTAMYPISGRYFGPNLMQILQESVGYIQGQLGINRESAELYAFAIATISRDFPHLIHNGFCFLDRFGNPTESMKKVLNRAIWVIRENPKLSAHQIARMI